MKNTRKNIVFIAFCCGLLQMAAISGCAQKGPVLFRDSFDSTRFHTNWKRIEAGRASAIQRSDSVARNGRYSIRVELNRSDADAGGSKRSEIVFASEKTPNIERWYKFSIYLPKNYVVDPVHEILAQWHEIPDKDLGEDWRTPPISLQVAKGAWIASIKWATAQVNTNETISGKIDTSLGNIETGAWTDWIFHIRFSYSNTGIMQIWKNGRQVFNYNGPNYYNDKKGPFFKMGIYKSGWKNANSKNFKASTTSKRVIYFDDIMIGNEKGRLRDFLQQPAQ